MTDAECDAIAREADLRKALKGCPACDYDEAEGGLVCHCPACCFKVTQAAWLLIHGDSTSLDAAPKGPEAQPVAWRWRPKGGEVWHYDPQTEWMERQGDAIEKQPLYAAPQAEGTKRSTDGSGQLGEDAGRAASESRQPARTEQTLPSPSTPLPNAGDAPSLAWQAGYKMGKMGEALGHEEIDALRAELERQRAALRYRQGLIEQACDWIARAPQQDGKPFDLDSEQGRLIIALNAARERALEGELPRALIRAGEQRATDGAAARTRGDGCSAARSGREKPDAPSTLTDEQCDEIARRAFAGLIAFPVTRDDIRAIVREARAALAQEPVAWATPSLLVTLSAVEKNHLTDPDRRKRGREFELAAQDAERYNVPLYAAPPAAQEQRSTDGARTDHYRDHRETRKDVNADMALPCASSADCNPRPDHGNGERTGTNREPLSEAGRSAPSTPQEPPASGQEDALLAKGRWLHFADAPQYVNDFVDEVNRQLDALAARLAQAEKEREQLRELLNVYNLGGWTDSERLIKERDTLRAENERLRKALDWLSSWTEGDIQICPPGQHGGAPDTWIVGLDSDKREGPARGYRWSCDGEGKTLLDAIDACSRALGAADHDRSSR